MSMLQHSNLSTKDVSIPAGVAPATSATTLSVADGADLGQSRRELLAVHAEAAAETARIREAVGTYTIEVSLQAHRGTRDRDIPFTLNVVLSGGRMSHGGGDVTMFWCSRHAGRAERDPRRLFRDTAQKWSEPISASGCGRPIHPDHHQSARFIICPHCGLMSHPKTLRAVIGDQRSLRGIAETVAPVFQKLGGDANLLLVLWNTDSMSPVFQSTSNKWDYEKTLATSVGAMYLARSILRDQQAGSVSLGDLFFRFLSA